MTSMPSTANRKATREGWPKKDEYEELRRVVDELRRRHLKSPPAGDKWVDDAHSVVFATAYVTKLRDIVLDRALSGLEAGFVKELRNSYIAPDRDRLTNPVLARARQLRFIARYSMIVGYVGYKRILPDPITSARERKRIGGRMRKLAQDLTHQWRDEELVESLGKHTLDELGRMMHILPRLATELEDVRPNYAFKNQSPLASEKELVRLIAQLCFRVYEWCDADVVAQLLEVPWDKCDFSLTPRRVTQVINDSLDGKVRQFQSRVDEAPWEVAREDLAWCPPTSLDPLQPRLD